jgi:integrase
LSIALERIHRRNGRLGQITLSELVAEYLAQHEAAPRTIAKLRWLLAKATGAFGECRVVDLRSDEIGAWRATLPEGHRFEATQALRQVLNRAVAWKIIDSNPAKAGVDNPRRQHPEKRPFESWAEIDALAEQLGPVYGPMIVFAAATGLRPGEWIALEHRDLDRDARVVYVRRAFAHGRLQRTKTRRSAPCRCRRSRWRHSTGCRPDGTHRCSFRRRGAAISTYTTSGAAPGDPPNATPGSSRCGDRTTSATRSPLSPCEQASPRSTSPASWAQA